MHEIVFLSLENYLKLKNIASFLHKLEHNFSFFLTFIALTLNLKRDEFVTSRQSFNLKKEGMKEKKSYERRNYYKAVTDAPQSETIWGKTSQMLSSGIKG